MNVNGNDITVTIGADVQKATNQINKFTNAVKGLSSESGRVKNLISKFKGKIKLKIDSSDADKATKKMTKLQKVFSSFTRIAFYRAVRSAIKFVTDGFKEGLENAYQFSKGVNGPLSSALDNLSSAGLKMKNQLGAAFGQLLVAVTPILLKLIDIVTAAANAVTEFFALLSGQSTYLKAKTYWKEWGDAASGAGSAAKEALKYLAPFDELNVLPSEKASSSGGGASTPDYASMFEEVKVDSFEFNLSNILESASDIFNSLSESISKIDWVQLGKDVYSEISDGITGGDFDDLASSFFTLFGTSLGAATGFIAGFVEQAVQDIKDYFLKYIEDENQDGKFGGAEIIHGLVRGMWDAVIHLPDWIQKNVIDPTVDGFLKGFGIEDKESEEAKIWGSAIGNGLMNGFAATNPILGFILGIGNLVDAVKNLLGIHSPSTVFAEIGENIGQGLWNGVREKWDKLKTWWSNLSLGEFKIKTPHISWTSTPASGWIANVLSTLGLPTSLPKLNVSWYARGGIVDKASLIGAGEAGKEAIVPLERNTQWVGMVASQLENQLGNRNGGGYNADLADDLEDANGVVVNAIFAATAEIVRAMSRNSGNGQNNSIDIDAVARQVTRWQNNLARANGI